MPLTSGLFAIVFLLAPPSPSSITAKPPTPKTAPVPKVAPAPKFSPDVVARAGDRDITRPELMEALAAVGVRDAVMQWLNQKVALEKEAKKLGVSLSDAEVKKKLNEEKAKVVENAIRAVGQPMTFDEVRQRFGVTLNEMEWRIRLNLLATKTYDKYLESQVPSLKGQRKLAHILIATIPLNGGAPPMTSEETKAREDEAKKKIDAILADIKAGTITFEKAAQQFSDDKGPDGRGSATNGGGMPFAGKGVFDAAFEKAAWALSKSGEISVPVKSRFGWHLIKLIRKGEDATAAELATYRQEYLATTKADPRQFPQWLNNLIRSQNLLFNTNFQLAEPRNKKKR
jgi:parvulin-like peptidyl-prolyl isomerase